MGNSTNDTILDELKGLNASVKQIDPPSEKPLDSAASLEVQAPQISATRRMDAKHATVSGGKGYSVVVKGVYLAPSPADPRKKVAKPYEIEVNVPKLEGALSLIKNHLLRPAVLRKHPEAGYIQTHEIVSQRPLSPATPETRNLQYMNHDALSAYVKDNAVPIDLATPGYDDVVVLRESIIDYTLNPRGFEKREAERKTKREEVAALMALNPQLNDSPKPEPGTAAVEDGADTDASL